MPTAVRVLDLRLVLAAALLLVSLSGCDALDIFSKKKPPLVGERVAVFTERGELEPDKEAANIQVILPAPVVNESWPQSGGFANYAMQHLSIGDAPQIIWTADVGAGSTSSRVLTTPPVVADGKVFAKDAQSTVSAFNADTGQRLWSVTLKPDKARDTDEFGGGLAYYGGRLFVTTGFAEVFSLDPADGKEMWMSTVSAPVRGAPLVFGDRVFAVSIDNKLHALAAVDGSDLWSFSALSEVAGYVGGNSPAGSGDMIVAPFTSGELVGLRLDSGRTVWNESLIG
ncbi:MAG: PQQ-binding-like beta-propeller repeat protein, partial [Reyranellales bacterium]